jgi:hypothetical protein
MKKKDIEKLQSDLRAEKGQANMWKDEVHIRDIFILDFKKQIVQLNEDLATQVRLNSNALADAKRLDWIDEHKAETDWEGGRGVIIYTDEEPLGYGASGGTWPNVRMAIDASITRSISKTKE